MHNFLPKVLFVYLLFLAFSSNAQLDGNLLWVLRDDSLPNPVMAGSGDDRGYGLDVDDDGNIYSAGWYNSNNIGIYKTNPEGEIVWETKVTSTGSFRAAAGNSIKVGNNGIYICGYYAGSSSGTTMTFSQANGGNDVVGPSVDYPVFFVIKYSTTGYYQWVQYFIQDGTTYSNQSALYDMDLDASDNVYIVGRYNTPLKDVSGTYSLSMGTCVPNDYNIGFDGFIARINYYGGIAWAKGIDSERETYLAGVSVDGSNVYTIGYHRGDYLGQTSWTSGIPACTAGSNPNYLFGYDGIILKYSTTGTNAWTKFITGSDDYSYGEDYDDHLGVDIIADNGDIYITYSFEKDVLAEISGVASTVSGFTTYSRDLGIAKLIDNTSSNLTISWMQKVGNPTAGYYTPYVHGKTLVIDPLGRLNVLTRAPRIKDFSTHSSPQTSSTSPATLSIGVNATGTSYYDAAIIRYNSSGTYADSKLFWGTGDEYLTGIHFFDDAYYLSGFFSGSMNFTNNVNNQYRLSAGYYDAFVAKYDCPTVTLTPEKDTVCYGEVIDVYAKMNCPDGSCEFSYEWTDVVSGTTITNSLSSYSINTSNLGANQLIVKATEVSSGCVTRDTFDFVVNEQVLVTTSLNNAIICYGDSITIGASSTPSNGATYLWYTDTDTISTAQNPKFYEKNVYTVEVNVNGCKGTQSVNVDYYPFTSPAVVPDTAAICANSGALLTVIDCPSCSYSWTPPPTSTNTSNTSTFLADVPGIYAVNMLDQYGCDILLTKEVTTGSVITPPIYSENIDGAILTTICNGEPLIIKSVPYDSCLNCTYEWSNGETGPYVFAYNTGVYNVTITDNLTGCVGTSSDLQILSTTLPDPIVNSDPNTICSPSSSAILEVANSCIGCVYSWYKNTSSSPLYLGGGLTYSIFNASDTGDYFVLVEDSLGCLAASSVVSVDADTVSIPPITTSTNTLCGTNTAVVSTPECIGCSYQWYFNNVNAIGGATTHEYIASTPGLYRVEVKFPNTCIRRSNNVVLTSGTFSPTIGPADPFICDGNPVDLFISSSFEEPPYWSYQWYYNGNPIPNSTGYVHTALVAGTYSVEVVNDDGCVSMSNNILVQASSEGANPVITATPSLYRCTGASITLSATPCTTCEYIWKDASTGNVQAPTGYPAGATYVANASQGYYVVVRDSASNCTYQSSVVEIKDTTLPTPLVTVASTTNICSTAPVILSTDACPFCTYIWSYNGFDQSGNVVTWEDTVSQNTYSVDTTGNYKVKVLQSGCLSPYSSSVPVTRLPFTAQLSAPPISSVCNGDTVLLEALPDTASCPNCQYEWYESGVLIPLPDSQDYYNVIQGGSYNLIVKQTFPGYTSTPYTFGCSDTTSALSFQDVALSTDLQSTSLAVCGPSGQVTLSVDSCTGCSYRWYYDGDTIAGGFNYNTLAGETDTFYVVNGTAAKGMYKIEVGLNGCVVYDSIYLFDTTALVFTLDTSSAPYANICNGVSVTMSSNCPRCSNYQWYLDGNVIPGAVGASYEAASGGDYQLFVNDLIGCTATSPLTSVFEVTPPAGFELLLDPIGVVPISYGDIELNQYLTPSSLHGVGTYTAVPQPAAILQDSFYPVNAGPGAHLVTYSYDYQNCTFSTSDTIEVLSQMSLDVVNLNPIAPPYESCLNDDLEFYLNNFTFAPNQILFATSATTYDTLALSAAQVNLTTNAGVYSGTIDVTVPLGAVTGKVIFRDSIGGEFYQSQFFLVVQNPSVAISLNGVQQPLCSSDDTISLTGFPVPGTFKAAYAASPTVYEPTLINGNNLVVENVTNYDPFSRIQNLEVTYVYWPTYSNVITVGAAAQCPDSVVAILPVQVNNNELDSVDYTPISATQAVMPMADMTRGIYPILNRNFPGDYIGTYVTNNNLLASTVPMPAATPSVTDPVIYTFSNQTCTNSVSEDVEIWARPSILDSIPEWICRNADTIFIGRNASGLYVQVAGVTTPIIDANYVLKDTIISVAGVRDYQEKINVLSINSSNGGLYTMPGSNPGNELFALVPDSIQGGATTLSLQFNYERIGSYFTPTGAPDVVNYTIAYVERVVNVEDPFVTEISPAILADTIFCQDNQTEQFSGTPLGGQYYINGDTLVSNIFNPNQIASAYLPGTQELIYVYTGNACVDADTALIYIPDTFTVTINAPTTYCRLDSAEFIDVITSDVVDTAAGVFYVNYTVSGQVFNPAVSPAILGDNSIFYIATDTFGCQVSSDTIIFTVNPMPSIDMTPLAPAYCLNAANVPILLTEDTLFEAGDVFLTQAGTAIQWNNTLPNAYASNDFASIQVTLSANGIIAADASNPAAPYYRPSVAGVGHDTLIYTFTNTATGCSTTIEETTYIKALPDLDLFTYDLNNDSVALNNSYCEYDTIPIDATPAGGSYFSAFVTGGLASSFDTTYADPWFTPYIAGPSPDVITEVLAYTYQDPLTLCRDTILDTVEIRNMTTELGITGFPGDSICANDIIIPLGINVLAQSPTTPAYSPGYFGAYFEIDTAMIVDSVNGDFNPYYSGITDVGRKVVVTYTYDVNACTNIILDTVFLNPVPQLSYLQVFDPDVQAPLVDNLIGDSLFNSSDPLPHICFSADSIQMVILNRYYGATSQINGSGGYAGPADTSITGWFSTASGLGARYDPLLGVWYYDTLRASGIDTLFFTYKDQNACVNTLTMPVFIDTVPELGFAGYQGNYLGINDEEGLIYDYCENDAGHLLIPTPFGGNTYWNYNPIPSILFELRPDTLVVGGVPTYHRLTYEFISARYEGGGVCLDSIVDSILVKPTPVLSMATSIPDFFCLSDDNERLPLSATPYGGYFEDATNNYSVLGGIVGDSIFVPAAQMGTREVHYVYSDTVSANLTGCADTLIHFIDVYNMPDVGFETGGGCEGDTVVFIPDNLNLDNVLPAIDSITMVVWDYGDGIIDSLVDSTLNLTNPIVIPNQEHIYNTAGVYYPSLTVVNRDGCDTTFMKRIVVSPKFVALDTTPYFQDFENGPASWFQENGDSSIFLPTDSLWAWGMATGSRIETANAANHVWSTAPTGVYSQGQSAWVYSPCFDITDLDRPMVALDIWRDTREGVDGVVMQYFDEGSASWKTLGIRGKGINWYNPSYVISSPGYQAGAPIGWSGSSEIVGGRGWEDARYRLDVSGGDLRYRDNLRLRIAFASTDNSVVGNLEGFAFDNFYLGNRQRSVLVEHFSNQNYADIDLIETALYNEIYSNLYGRDVNLIQYHVNDNGFDYLHQDASDDNSARDSYYGITSANQVRVNGQPLVSTTDSLINHALEILDMQMLEDAKYKIEQPLVNITAANNEMEISANVIAIQDLPVGDYRAFTVITEDSIVSLQNHKMMAVMRKMLPDAAGDTLNSMPLAYADTFQIFHEWNYDLTKHDPNNLLVVFFVQNYATKEVYQVATTRNLNIFTGPVAVDDLEDKDGKELLSLKLFPNPTRDLFFVEFSQHLQSEYDWQLVDVTGRTLKSGVAEPGTLRMQVETDNLSPGMYIFTIKNENVRIQRKVIIAK